MMKYLTFMLAWMGCFSAAFYPVALAQDAVELPEFSANTPQLYNAFLTHVPDIHVETYLGHLPALPARLKGTYQNNHEGPEVVVIWPSPKNNSQVSKAGNYYVTGHVPGTNLQPRAKVTVLPATAPATPPQQLQMFALNQVVLHAHENGHPSKFIENRDKFLNGLARVNPDNFLYMFRNAFGQAQPNGALALGVWDSQTIKLRGHATGHYLSGLAQAYAGTGYDTTLQAAFAHNMEYMVQTLYALAQQSGKPHIPGGTCVANPAAVPPGPGKCSYSSNLTEEGMRTDFWNWGLGYLSAYPPDQFILLEQGASYGTRDNQVWAPYYTLHKILAGLLDVYEISKNEKALTLVKGMGNWVHARLSALPADTLTAMWNTYIAGEYGGMNEVMARLYRLTGEPHYLETARLFDNTRVFFGDAEHTGGLAKNVDLFRGLHANQHIPQMVGAIELYKTTHAAEYYRIADNFWKMTTQHYMYSIGGVAGARHQPNNSECFIPEPQTLYANGFNKDGQNETCATYNLLKLTRNLFLFQPNAALMDYYERALYNHILASVDEHTPGNTYHVPLRMGSVKHFGNPDMSGFTCCNGTALESNTKFQNTIYSRSADNRALYVNLFIPSTLQWPEKGMRISQTTNYPNEDCTRLTMQGNGAFELKVRVPHWATNGFFVKINGVEEQVQAHPGSYVTLNRKWQNGDVVDVRMPFRFYLEPVMDQQNIASLFYGPVLLAAQESGPLESWRQIHLHAGDIGKSISGNPEQLEFMIDGVVFKPFYDSYGHHSVYVDVRLK